MHTRKAIAYLTFWCIFFLDCFLWKYVCVYVCINIKTNKTICEFIDIIQIDTISMWILNFLCHENIFKNSICIIILYYFMSLYHNLFNQAPILGQVLFNFSYFIYSYNKLPFHNCLIPASAILTINFQEWNWRVKW